MKPYFLTLLLLPACLNLSKPWEGKDAATTSGDAFTWPGDVIASGGVVRDVGTSVDLLEDSALGNPDVRDALSPDVVDLPDVEKKVDSSIVDEVAPPDLGHYDTQRPDADVRDAGADRSPDTTGDTSVDLAVDAAMPDVAFDPFAGLVAYYPLDSMFGTNQLMDSSGKNRHAEVAGGYQFTPGRVGQALVLLAGVDGGAGNGHVVLPQDFLSNMRVISLSMWFWCNSKAPWQRLVEISSSDGSNALAITPFTDGSTQVLRLEFSAGGDSKKTLDGPEIRTGVWRHMVLVMDADSVRLYFDGALFSTSTTILKRPVDMGSTSTNYLGRSRFSKDPYFDGQIDEFRLYDRALSADEIRTLHAL